MKKQFLLFLLLFLLSVFSFGNVVTLDGIFQGKNLYVMNPFSSSGVGFCVYEVKVNGQVTTDEINSSAFEIDLSLYQLKLGDKLEVVIKHKENCKPKVLNPEVLKPKSTFKTVSIEVSKDGYIKWTTSGEAGKLPFDVQQYRWNKWIKVGTVKGNGTPGSNSYKLKVSPHSGNNRFRVRQIDYTKRANYSTDANFRSMSPSVTFEPKKATTIINFSNETQYEVYDYYGNIVLKGVGKNIDISKLAKGDYFLNFDNTMDTFKKK